MLPKSAMEIIPFATHSTADFVSASRMIWLTMESLTISTRRTKISHENWNNKSSGLYSNNPKSKGSSSNSNSLASGTTPKALDSTFSGSTSTPKLYANKLGKDSHLTQEEKDLCKKNNLCMFCGGKHKTDDCNKCKATASTKGHAAEVEDPSPASEEPAPSESEN
ncbi:uncharacterized protein ARMOST_03198 [Armillaria ostoyae]|uniref:Uncharacterized protein n=1 Tax=Armillaria ostoyae TaxID=47428 RepID=A0A284QTW1_ARMOS|nr:uncharacterized protein ARMOST_03198 [Armillaria ostoyae]